MFLIEKSRDRPLWVLKSGLTVLLQIPSCGEELAPLHNNPTHQILHPSIFGPRGTSDVMTRFLPAFVMAERQPYYKLVAIL